MEDVYVAYISGPMTHAPDLGEAVAIAAKVNGRLVDMGFYVYNPYGSCLHASCWAVPHDKWLENDFYWIEMCDAIVMLPGWEDSDGCKQECVHALELGLDIMVWDDAVGKVNMLAEGDA